VHTYDANVDRLADKIVAYATERIRLDPPLDRCATEEELWAAVGQTITADGIGSDAALHVFTDVLAPATISQDSPRNLSFVPSGPTPAAVLFDLVVSASCICPESWQEGSGAIYAENQALRWLADLAGFPAAAGGVFVSGGSAGNLSALVAARETAVNRRLAAGHERPPRWILISSFEAHSSVKLAARVMDVDVITVPGDERGRLTGKALEAQFSHGLPEGVFAVSSTAGTTNLGVVDDLSGVAEFARKHGIWMHVDGAYGGAALAAPSVRRLFAGIEHADSFVVDPHKWLFAPYDCAALIYRDPALAKAAHTQKAGYLDVLQAHDEWNPSDYAFHLTRRARGLPFWFSLATHGTNAYAAAIEETLATALRAAELVEAHPRLELCLAPELSVVVFRRPGWETSDYGKWSADVLSHNIAYVVPTVHQGAPALRFCIVNPETTVAHIRAILATL
jgi:L-2,4-diaminobutyrate decarboxylase